MLNKINFLCELLICAMVRCRNTLAIALKFILKKGGVLKNDWGVLSYSSVNIVLN